MMNRSIFLFSTINLYQGNTAGSSRATKYAKALSSSNNVYLLSLTASRHLSLGSIQEVEDRIFVVGRKRKYDNKVLRRLWYPFGVLSFAVRMDRLARRLDSNATFLLYPSTEIFLDLVSVVYLRKIRKARVFLEVNEVRRFASSIKAALAHRPFSGRLYGRYLRAKFELSERLSRYFTGLLCISTNIQEYFAKYNRNSIRIPVLSDSSVLPASQKRYDSGDRFLICFAGSIDIAKENLDSFLLSLRMLKESFNAFEFHLYGPVEQIELRRVNQLIRHYDLAANVEYKGWVPQSELSAVFPRYHLLVSPRGNNLQNRYGFSTKIAEYLASGVPALVTDVSDNSLFLKDGQNGFVVPPDDPSRMTLKLIDVINNYNSYRARIVSGATATVRQQFAYRNYSKKLEAFLCSNESRPA